jgi:hypothetical protein
MARKQHLDALISGLAAWEAPTIHVRGPTSRARIYTDRICAATTCAAPTSRTPISRPSASCPNLRRRSSPARSSTTPEQAPSTEAPKSSVSRRTTTGFPPTAATRHRQSDADHSRHIAGRRGAERHSPGCRPPHRWSASSGRSVSVSAISMCATRSGSLPRRRLLGSPRVFGCRLRRATARWRRGERSRRGRRTRPERSDRIVPPVCVRRLTSQRLTVPSRSVAGRCADSCS